ncbi:MAG: helix-turn-helix transcriptional regulator, partial [Candidatus Parcubacteria bacterium]|nr:helix-turn-helix transcriptional regulator [Candidatus Parcubacteria bacterium]
MIKNLKKFGDLLWGLRIKKELTLREMCEMVNYDPSNWSKIERGRLSPPSDRAVLSKWAKALGLTDKIEIENFIDLAQVSQGIIPEDILSQKDAVGYLPAFFRTLRNERPTQEEICK